MKAIKVFGALITIIATGFSIYMSVVVSKSIGQSGPLGDLPALLIFFFFILLSLLFIWIGVRLFKKKPKGGDRSPEVNDVV